MTKQEIRRDVYEISDGNLAVLTLIPKMLRNKKYKIELRRLVLDYIQETEIKNDKRAN